VFKIKLLICLLLSTGLFATHGYVRFCDTKDTSRVKLLDLKFSHVVGAGVQWLTTIAYGYGHGGTEIHYQSPSPLAFYRLMITTKRHNKTTLTASGLKRRGYGWVSGGGLGGGTSIKGTFDFVRLDLGLHHFLCFGRKRLMAFGFGASIGFLPYIKATMVKRTWSVTSGPNSQEVGALEGVNSTNLTASIELYRELKVHNKQSLLIGLRGMLETPDGFNGYSGAPFWLFSKAGKIAIAYIGYKIS
jgi:hypothetical protein